MRAKIIQMSKKATRIEKSFKPKANKTPAKVAKSKTSAKDTKKSTS